MARSPEQSELSVHVDFDWTLHDTTAFINDLWPMIAIASSRPLDEVAKDGDHFHADPVLGGYSYDDHVASYGLDAVEMWQKVHDMVHANDYLYPESAHFIQNLRKAGFDPKLLSFGETRFQTAKIKPTLSRLVGGNSTKPLEVEIVFCKKRELLAEKYAGRHGVLVDDVAGQQLPDGFTEIHFDRDSGLIEPQETESGFVVGSLYQALDVIKNL